MSRRRLELAEQVLDSARELEAESRRAAERLELQYERERGAADELREALARTQALLDRAVAQLERALDTVATMRREGFESRVDLPLPPKTDVRPLPQGIAQAIALRSDPNTRERRQLEGHARELLAAGMAAAEVEELVLHGQEVDV